MTSQKFHGVFGSLLKEKAAQAAAKAQKSQTSGDAAVVPVQSAPKLQKGQIAVDVFEEGGYIVIKAPIAGVKLSDLDIDVAENVITIRGKRKQSDELEDSQYLVQECYWGEFSRSVTLPHHVNPTKVRATFSKDGILKVFVPTAEKKIKIVKINEGG
jgi:HSP20 family molecular chaperone IbpA